jgi:YidC/Oxa1 family membrane protein insertase
MTFLYHTFIADPIINAMVAIYNTLPIQDLGITIIILTLIIRLILLPLSYRAARTQREMAKIQPKLKEIQKKFKDNKEEQAKKLMEIYKQHKINPLAGFIPLLIQLPVLIALYRAFMAIINDASQLPLYSFVSAPQVINASFLGIVNLATPSIALAVIAGLSQFGYSKLMTTVGKTNQESNKNKKAGGISTMLGSQMTYFLPVITILIGSRLPAGLPLYWATTTLFSVSEQFFVRRKQDNNQSKNPQKEPLKDNKTKSHQKA